MLRARRWNSGRAVALSTQLTSTVVHELNRNLVWRSIVSIGVAEKKMYSGRSRPGTQLPVGRFTVLANSVSVFCCAAC